MGPILDAFERVASVQPHREALWSRGEGLRLSFARLVERVRDRAAQLPRGAGLPVALAVGNVAAFPELFLALRRNGAVVVSLDAGLPSATLRETCRTLGIPWLLEREQAAAGAPEGTDLGEGIRLVPLPGVEAAPTPPGTALVKLTSGSTGRPRGVCFTEEALFTGIGQIAEGMGISRADRVLIAIPLSHSYGFDSGVLSLAVVGTPLVLASGRFPRPLIAALAEAQATVLPMVPPLVHALGRTAWPPGLPLRLAISAGGPLGDESARQFRRRSGRPVHQFYGATEAGGITFERWPEEPAAAGAVGHPLPGVEVELDAGGSVQVRSGANLTGDLGTAEGGGTRVVRTGDRGAWTPEGRLRLVGRNTEILNIGGRKVPAASIEAALRGLEGVEEAAAVGVEDPVRGDRVIAFVVTSRDRLDISRLPAVLAPREVRRVERLPYTERGKLDRARLREMAREPS